MKKYQFSIYFYYKIHGSRDKARNKIGSRTFNATQITMYNLKK